MAVSAAVTSSAPDKLLGTVLEELLEAVEGGVLGWIYLDQGPPDNLSWPAVTISPQHTMYLAAVRHAARECPESGSLTCPDCPCLRSFVGADPLLKYSVIDHCPQPALSELSVSAHASVPLVAKDRPVGLLNIAKAGSPSFSTIELLLLQTIGRQLSIALENARLIGETQARLKEQQTLLEVSYSVNSTLDLHEAIRRIARAVARALSADTVGAYVQDPSTGDLQPFAGYHVPRERLSVFMGTQLPLKGNHFLEEAWEKKSAVYTDDTSSDPRCAHEIFRLLRHRSILFVPMLVKDQPVGGLLAVWWDVQHEFDEEKVRLVDAIARQTAIAIENAKLFQEVQTHVEAVKASEEKYRLLAEQVRDVIYALDREGRFTYLNPKIEEMLGYKPEELLGRYSTDVLTPQSQRQAQESFIKTARGKDPFSFYELDMVKKGGSGIVRVEIGTVTVRDAAGRVTGWQGIARDITERKQLEQQLLRAERLHALGEMSSGVAHDFNNILGAILGRAQLLRRAERDEETQRGLEAIEKAALDGANTVRRLQHFTRKRREEEFFPVDLNQAIKDALAITEARWKDEANLAGVTIEVATDYGSISPVMGNISELREVLTNMIFNAIEAMPEGGKLTFKTEEASGWVCLSVSDTGLGMSDDVKARIFDPFFTTKGVKGTGLGMSVSYGIIRGHNGEINVESHPGQGTTMLIKLPIPAKLRPAPQPKLIPSARPGRILVIDDDGMVRELLSDILEAAGHTVVKAAGGREGIRLFRQDAFDLVLTDLGMPDCSGWEVATAVKGIAPRTPVALVTGWGLTLDRRKMKESGVDLVLNKPFQYPEVMALVAEGMELREKI
jgi:PAS domain S-box-containing protein